MKYLVISTIFHFGILSAVFATGWSFSHGENQAEPIFIEIQNVDLPSSSLPPPPQRVAQVLSAPAAGMEKTVPEMVESLVKEKPSTEKNAASEGTPPLDYIEELRAYLEKNKRYPRAALRLRQSGVVQLRLVIGNDGKFEQVEILAPSPFESLNTAALELVSGLKKFKPLPENLRGDGEFIVPIAYRLKGSAL